jgi:hypothetical protein
MKKLYDLDVAEVSLVPRGANKKKFIVYKSRGGKNVGAREEIRKLLKDVDPKVIGKIDKVLKGESGDMLPRKDSAVYKEPEGEPHGDQEHAASGLSERAKAALKAMGRIAAPFKDELNQGHVKSVMHAAGVMPEGEPDDKHTEGMHAMHDKEGSKAIPMKVEDEHHAEALDMARKAYNSHLEKMGYRKYPDEQPKVGSKSHKEMEDDDDEEDGVEKSRVSKGLRSFSPEQREELEVIFKSNRDLVRKNADLEEQLKEERDIRKSREFKEKASTFKHLGVKTDELSTVLKSLAEVDEDTAEKVESILKAADKQVSEGNLYGEIGSRLSSNGTGEGDAAAKIDTIVEKMVQKSDGSKTSDELYYDFITKTPEGKKLYREYRNERIAKGGC